VSRFGAAGRLLLWEYERGSWAYDVVCVLIAVFLTLVPAAWLGDPMRVRP